MSKAGGGYHTGRTLYVNYTGITAMYGAAHCTTQIFRLPSSVRRSGTRPIPAAPIHLAAASGDAGGGSPCSRWSAYRSPLMVATGLLLALMIRTLGRAFYARV